LVHDHVTFETSNRSISKPVIAEFGAIEHEHPLGSFEPGQVDGIMGFAYKVNHISCAPNCFTPFFDSFVKQTGCKDIFALHINQISNAAGPGGLIYFGGYEIPKNYSKIFWTPLAEEYFYVVTLYQVKLGNDIIQPEDPSTVGTGITIIDSGTSELLLQNETFHNFKKTMISKYSDLPYITGQYNIFDYCINCTLPIEKYPNITFYFENLEVVLTPQDYFNVFKKNKKVYYCLAIGCRLQHKNYCFRRFIYESILSCL